MRLSPVDTSHRSINLALRLEASVSIKCPLEMMTMTWVACAIELFALHSKQRARLKDLLVARYCNMQLGAMANMLFVLPVMLIMSQAGWCVDGFRSIEANLTSFIHRYGVPKTAKTHTMLQFLLK